MLNQQSLVRGPILEPCDICEQNQFDVQEVFNGAIEPWNWDSSMICASCRFTAAQYQVKLDAEIERCYREEQQWLDNGGQELIDQPKVTPASDIIKEALEASDLTLDELIKQAPFSCSYVGEKLELLMALETLQGNGYVDDEWFGDDGTHYEYRIDRWIVDRLESGLELMEFATEHEAEVYWTELDMVEKDG